MGLALPPKRITINMSPADLPKEGSHYDLPIALALLAAMGVTDGEQLGDFLAVGECRWMGGSPPRPACCWPRSTPASGNWD
jgi:magnesium chelatase family protein